MLGKTVESVVHEFDDIVLIKFTDIRCEVFDKDLFEKDVLSYYGSDEIKRKGGEELKLFND